MTERTALPPVVEGDSHVYTMTFTDDAGTAYDITNWTIYFTVKNRVADADTDALITKDVTSHTDPTNGKTEIRLQPADTKDVTPGRYHYDIQTKNGAGEVRTVALGTFEVTEGITDRTA